MDAVTQRRADFHAEILRLLELDEGGTRRAPGPLYTAAYHAFGAGHRRQLQAWAEPLAVGAALPRLPLWLGLDLCVPRDLEASYVATCEDLRIRTAS